MISRPQLGSPRFFPVIQPELYDQHDNSELNPEQRAAIYVLSLEAQPLTKPQQLIGWKLEGIGQMGRLLYYHHLGLKAELAAKWQRADFFWQQVQHHIKEHQANKDVWRELAGAIASAYPDAEQLAQPETLCQRIISEVLVDTHCAFYNGLIQRLETLDAEADGPTRDGPTRDGQSSKQLSMADSLRDRAFDHIRYLEGLLSHTHLDEDACWNLLEQPWQTQMTRYQKAAQWKKAARLGQERLRYKPKSMEYQTDLAGIYVSQTLKRLKHDKSERAQLRDAKLLASGIKTLETLANTYPHNLAILNFLANFHHQHAICLGNGNKVAEALVAVAKARITNPYLQSTLETQNQLIKVMNQLNAYAKQMQAQLARNPRATANAKGRALINQAKKGVSLQDKYLKSAAAKDLVERVKRAEAMTIWHQIEGLGDEPDEEQVLTLLKAISHIVNHPPTQKEGLPALWQAVVADHPSLTTLDRERIQSFLAERLWGITKPSPIIPPPPSDHPSDPTIVPDDPPFLPASVQPIFSLEPLLPWLLSHQNLGLKAQVAVAAIALLTVGGLTLNDRSVRQQRQIAYDTLISIDGVKQPVAVMEAAEDFLSRTPFSGKDDREETVKDLYTQAFVNWFMQQSDTVDDADLQSQVERYQTLTQ